MRYYLTASILCLSIIVAPPTAFGAPCEPDAATGKNCLGQECTADSIGVSRLDGDQTNVLICLYGDASHASTVWKSMSTGTADVPCPSFNIGMSLMAPSTKVISPKTMVMFSVPNSSSGETVSSNKVTWTFPPSAEIPNGTFSIQFSAVCMSGVSYISEIHENKSCTDAQFKYPTQYISASGPKAYDTVTAGAPFPCNLAKKLNFSL